MSLRRFQSGFIKEQYERDIALMRSSLKSILPKGIASSRTLFAALETALAFTTWRRLRQDQNLSVESAKDSIRLILTGLIADIDVE